MNPILLDIPDSFETDRLLIRIPRPGDGAELFAAIQETLDDLRPWMPWARQEVNLEGSEAVVRQAHFQFLERTDMMMLLFHKESGQLCGASGLHRFDWDVRKFEIGYWVRSSFKGQGLITEAVAGITQFAIDVLQANRVEIRCDKNNVRSAKVAERLGYTLEGILRQDSLEPDGELRDTKVFAKVRGVEF